MQIGDIVHCSSRGYRCYFKIVDEQPAPHGGTQYVTQQIVNNGGEVTKNSKPDIRGCRPIDPKKELDDFKRSLFAILKYIESLEQVGLFHPGTLDDTMKNLSHYYEQSKK